MCHNVKISLFKCKRFIEGRCNKKIMGGATFTWEKGSSVLFSDRRVTRDRFSQINGASRPFLPDPGGTRDISSNVCLRKGKPK